MRNLLGVGVLGILLSSCTCGGAPPDVPDDCTGELSLPPSVSTDILFVVDDSRSMREEQEKVAAELNTFVTSLVGGPIENDFQVGVVTTSLSQHARDCNPETEPVMVTWEGQSGRLQLGKNLDGVELPESTRRVLASSEGDLLAQFALLVGQGITGSGQEMGLEAARLAVSEPLVSTPLDASPPGNLGFLRPGSRLLVVIVSDEDDCSDPTGTALVLEPICGGACAADADCGGEGHYCILDSQGQRRCQHNPCETPEGRAQLEPVEDYVSFFQDLDDGFGRRREVFLAVLGAVDPQDPTSPSRCSGGGTEAQGRATRYVAAAEAMGESGLVDSICRDSYAEALQRIAELVNSPQVLELADSPPDGRLLVVKLVRGAETIDCALGEGFTFEAPVGEAPGRITMQGDCRLRFGDRVQIQLVCAG